MDRYRAFNRFHRFTAKKRRSFLKEEVSNLRDQYRNWVKSLDQSEEMRVNTW